MSTAGLTSGVSSGAWSAIGGGLRAQVQTQVHRQMFELAGVSSPRLQAGLDAIEQTGRQVTEAGLTAARSDLLGQFMDTLG